MGISGDRYKMAIVDLYSVKRRIERIIELYDQHGFEPSMELMSACVHDIMDAMQKTHHDRLSDPRYKIVPKCEADDCWENGDHKVCFTHTVDVKPKS